MVVCCCVQGCSNDWKPNSIIQFHRFPLKNELLLTHWLVAVGKNNFVPKAHTRICSAHFEAQDYCHPGSRKLLKPLAVPSIFINNFTKDESVNLKNGPVSVDIDDFLRPLEMSAFYTHQKNMKKEMLHQDYFDYSEKNNDLVDAEEVLDDNSILEHSKQVSVVSTQTNLTVISHANNYSSSKLSLRRKIKTLQQKLKRRDEKIMKMRNLIMYLRKEERASEKLKYVLTKNFNGFSAELFRHQYKNNKVKPKQRRYSDTMKKFALKLYFYSPRAYKFVRNNLQLPHCATLRKKRSQVQIQESLNTC